MNKPAFLLIVVLVSLLFNSCKFSPNLTEAEIFSIINQIIKDDNKAIDRVCWEFQYLKLEQEYAKEFTSTDIWFNKKQQMLFKNIRIKPKSLQWFRRGESKPTYISVDELCNQGIIYHISFPVISADRKKVLIEFNEDCNCMLGGGG